MANSYRDDEPDFAMLQLQRRGAPGDDHLDWEEIRAALVDIGFVGMLGIESFTADNETIATAASIWRPLAASQDTLAVEGLRFLQGSRAGFPE